MALERSFIPYGGYYSTPFCRWQGALAQENSLALAAATAKRFLDQREIAAQRIEALVLGYTVPQKHSFYGAPWVAGMMGLAHATGPTVSQACATSVRALFTAALEVEAGERRAVLALCADRTSNGPHVLYPNPAAPGGRGDAEDPVWDNFNLDPYAKNAMIETAENVAREAKISREEQDAIALMRFQQYRDALADDRAFQKKYLLPVELVRGKETAVVEADEGVFPTTAEGLARLKPVVAGGTVTFGSQTHPADGNAAMIVGSREQAQSFSRDPKITVQILGFGTARVKAGFMPMAVVPAARAALERAGAAMGAVAATKTHNPFAVNDACFAREMGVKLEHVNRFGSSLVYGHPQGPTGIRAIAELIEELVVRGGGLGLFSGCAAGDTAMAVVLRVS
ncbi:MAG: thiolase family protein [Deltaproteobacteria bacterium]|nr:thiolase family protein [Deltaproteobacteria bacterium]